MCFWEGCTCNPTTPAQSKPTFCTFCCSPFQDLRKSKRFKCAVDSGRRHLGHILDKGGTGASGSIWRHLGGIWEASTLDFPPWPQRCWRDWIPWHPFDTPGLLLGTPGTFLGTFLMPRAPLGTPWTALGINFWPHGAAPWHPMDIPWQQLWPSSVNVSKIMEKKHYFELHFWCVFGKGVHAI